MASVEASDRMKQRPRAPSRPSGWDRRDLGRLIGAGSPEVSDFQPSIHSKSVAELVRPRAVVEESLTPNPAALVVRIPMMRNALVERMALIRRSTIHATVGPIVGTRDGTSKPSTFF